jgi:hypothetical protein
MSTAPDTCLYCNGADPGCGFCDMGQPLDTQEDWDNSWGKILPPTKPKHGSQQRPHGHRPRGKYS